MPTFREAQGALAAVDLQPGLSFSAVQSRLHQGVRLKEAGQRILAFYLHEVAERRLYNKTSHKSTEAFAEALLQVERRRTAEYVAVGGKLLELPAIDAALCRGEIGWSKVLQLVKVATPAHDEAWLARAKQKTVRQLALDVRLSKPGQAPRAAGDRKGLPEIRFRVRASVDPVTHELWDQAKQKLGDELGRSVTDAECMAQLAELLLATEADGTVPGRKRVESSLYRVVLSPETPAEDALLALDTPDGPIPVAEDAAIRCDAEVVDPGCDHAPGEAHACTAPSIDGPTPSRLRRQVIARDKGRCRCCGSKRRLMVHHIQYRSKGGRTRACNLITLCMGCHALVHANLLILVGQRASEVRFEDADGRPVHESGRFVSPDALVRLRPPDPEPPADLPNVRQPKRVPRPEPKPRAEAFAGIVGQDTLIAKLDRLAAGSRERGRAFPHTLFLGPPGTGKTTLANAIAVRLGARLVEAFGPHLQTADDLRTAVAGLEAGDMLFLDEIHAVPRLVLESLYELMAKRPEIMILAATTEDGQLTRALRSRFGLREMLGFYEEADLAALAARTAEAEAFTIEPAAASALAQSSRGTPREALRLTDRTLDFVAAEGRRTVRPADVAATLDALGYDDRGLDPIEQRYLAELGRSRGPMPLGRLARILGASARTLVEHVEPYLFHLGLVQMTARGRLAV
ncbi:MAG: AAA family ATPase [Planctomycetota bacterium]|nr:AAA family ATPase [Planctomycetota bacterium]